MSEKEKQPDNDPERTLMTLDQLSQTIEVMSSVVNRLRQHLSEQLRIQAVRAQGGSSGGPSGTSDNAQTPEHRLNQNIQRSSNTNSQTSAGHKKRNDNSLTSNREPYVVEIRQQDLSSTRKSDKTLH
jgi:hypothetical protein